MLGLSPGAALSSPTLDLPARDSKALTGTRFTKQIAPLELSDRDQEIASQILSGNVPNFLRKLCPVQVMNTVNGQTNRATFFVTPDYLAVGSDEDYFLAPMSPEIAQLMADALSCSLPTPKMVDAIYEAAAVKLVPSPISPSADMTTVPVFSNHNYIIREQRGAY